MFDDSFLPFPSRMGSVFFEGVDANECWDVLIFSFELPATRSWGAKKQKYQAKC